MNYNHITLWIEINAECVSGEINKLFLKFGFEKHLRWLLTCKTYIIKSLKVAAAVKISSEGFIEERINSELATLKSGKRSRARPFRTLKTNIHIMRCILFSTGKQRNLNDCLAKNFLAFHWHLYVYRRSNLQAEVHTVVIHVQSALRFFSLRLCKHMSGSSSMENSMSLVTSADARDCFNNTGTPRQACLMKNLFRLFFFSPLLSCRSGLVHTSTFFPCLVHLKYGLIHKK